MHREALSCNDVLLVPRFSKIKSRSECDPATLFEPNYSLPIMAAPMDTVYSKELDLFLEEKNIPCIVHRYFPSAAEQLRHSAKIASSMNRFFAVGTNKKWIDCLVSNGIQHFCVDMAHGDTELCVETVEYIKNAVPESVVIAGNVATKSGFRRLEDAGAWAVRVGIGSGSICSTRLNTGFGVPLLTSVEDCASVKESALLIADGGLTYPGDLAKAIAFGADLCMMGRMFAGTDLAPGDCYYSYEGKKNYLCKYNQIDDELELFPPFTTSNTNRGYVTHKRYRGMASAEARQGVLKQASVEGVSGLIDYTGSTEDFIAGLHQNLQASLSYAGATNWKEFRRNTKKMRISSASWGESQTHVEMQ